MILKYENHFYLNRRSRRILFQRTDSCLLWPKKWFMVLMVLFNAFSSERWERIIHSCTYISRTDCTYLYNLLWQWYRMLFRSDSFQVYSTYLWHDEYTYNGLVADLLFPLSAGVLHLSPSCYIAIFITIITSLFTSIIIINKVKEEGGEEENG